MAWQTSYLRILSSLFKTGHDFSFISLDSNQFSVHVRKLPTIPTTCAILSHGRVPREDVCIGNYIKYLGNRGRYSTVLRAACQEGLSIMGRLSSCTCARKALLLPSSAQSFCCPDPWTDFITLSKDINYRHGNMHVCR